jgi:hypothetical protein
MKLLIIILAIFLSSCSVSTNSFIGTYRYSSGFTAEKINIISKDSFQYESYTCLADYKFLGSIKPENDYYLFSGDSIPHKSRFHYTKYNKKSSDSLYITLTDFKDEPLVFKYLMFNGVKLLMTNTEGEITVLNNPSINKLEVYRDSSCVIQNEFVNHNAFKIKLYVPSNGEIFFNNIKVKFKRRRLIYYWPSEDGLEKVTLKKVK